MTDPTLRRRVILLAAVAVTTTLLVLLVALRRDKLRAVLGTDQPGAGAPLALRLAFPADPAALARIDHARVHRTLWPAWVKLRHGTGADGAEARAAFAALRGALGGERNLTALLDELARRVAGDLRVEAARLLYLCWAWSAYLARYDKPWRLVGGLRRGKRPRDDLFYVKTYRVLHRVKKPQPLWVVRRVDPFDLGPEAATQASAEEGAFVVVGAVERFAVERLWPLLDARADAELFDAERSFARLLRPIVARALPRAAHAALRDSVGDRLVLRQTARLINARARCGSRFRLGAMPWWGLSTADEAALRDAVSRSRDDARCPEIKKAEERSLLAASDRLAKRAGLRAAVGALVSWLARGAAREALVELEAIKANCHCHKCLGLDPRAQPRLAALLSMLAHPEH
ncbi:MAG: hypothetical protein KC503_03645, partial [Myxococcales bacterium]|nr:hypothetical protein [Myxococcales bacterium]